MMSVEERLAHVEGLVEGQAQLLGDLRAAITGFEGRVDRRFETLDRKLDTKIDALDHKLDAKINALDRKLDAKIDVLDQGLRREMGNQFRWMMGLMVTLVAVVLGAALAR
jgi:hypothetical protein